MYANSMCRPGLKAADFVCNCHQLHEYTYKKYVFWFSMQLVSRVYLGILVFPVQKVFVEYLQGQIHCNFHV